MLMARHIRSCRRQRSDGVGDRAERGLWAGWPQSVDVEIRDNAEMPLPLSLADTAVDPFPQQVGVAAVTGVLLDHVDQNRAQRDASAIPIQALDAQVG